MAAKLIVHLVPTTTRLTTDCPVCGWADLWHITLHRLSTSGVTTMHDAIRCARCERKPDDLPMR